ncbi:MAG: hypothetical protein KBA32_03035 [Propionivibrio sp.]|jgi:hypothetical protein|nr:hypothetical protein [Propionivibrio sp.]MBP7202156.1 hypothetical protein [Propionivibrio sp.]
MNIDMMDSYGQSLKTDIGTLGAVFAAGSNEPLRWTQARRSGSGHRRHRC